MTGLNTLFEVLFFLSRSLAPFTPFLADHIYKLLIPRLQKKMIDSFDDPRSVHFLPYPTFRAELLDPIVERKVERMQKVVSLARISRERKTIGLKTPLKSLVVIHSDPTYLEDLSSLRLYICQEVNIHELELSSDESKYNVQYLCTADWPTLGKKLRKDAQKVKKLLPALSTQQVKDFVRDKTMNLDGITLTEEDLIVRKEIANSEGKNIETNSDNDVLTILDVELYSDLAEAGIAREIINRVQRLRKKAGLVTTDDVKMSYRVTADPQNTGLENVFTSHAQMIEAAVRGSMVPESNGASVYGSNLQKVIVEEEQEVQKATFLLKIMSL